MASRVTVYEVGPRDGLQNEGATVPTAEKLALLAALAGAGLSRIEASSFVSPRWIPQLADAGEVVAALPQREGTSYVVLVPNAKGLERLQEALLRAGPDAARVDAAVFLSASETHNQKNVNRSVAESLADLAVLVPAAVEQGLRVRGYVSTMWGCPYEGPVPPERGATIVERLLDMGCHQVSLGDTIGVGTPNQTRRILDLLLGFASPGQLALHMHDTRGTALANVLVGLEAGLSTFDASIGGLGGCPYAPGASGNLATEDLVYLLHGMGYETGIDWQKLIRAGALAQRIVKRPLPGKALQAELAAAAHAALA
jgi:hydroxymethylglutaryl-CoA lyase